MAGALPAATSGDWHRSQEPAVELSPLPAPSHRQWWLSAPRRPKPTDANLALANLPVAEGKYDRAVYALCAPIEHATIWRRDEESRSVFPDTTQVQTGYLPAEFVARQHTDGGRVFCGRYAPALTD